MPEAALKALQCHREEQDYDRDLYAASYQEHQLVFCRPDGGYYVPARVGGRVSALMTKIGLKGSSLHTLRHSHASELLSKHVPLPAVSKRLGHAGPHITMSIYAHALEADELAAAKIWDDAMASVIEENKRPTEEKPRWASVGAKLNIGLQLIEKKPA